MNALCLMALVFVAPSLSARPKNNEWDAKKYAQLSSPQFNNAVKEIPLLGLRGNETVLDIGCGTGKLAAYMLKKYVPRGSVHGIDASSDQIAQAQKEYGKNKHLSFSQADLLIYKPARTYDVVVSFWVLHWIKDYNRAMQQIFKFLKPGGKALIGQLAEHELFLSQEIKKMMQEDPWKQQCRAFEFPIYSMPFERIVQAAREAGFIIEYVQLINEKETFKDADAYKRHYQALPVTACVPVEKKEQFFEAAIKRALPQELHHKNGSITVNGYVVYMVLRKPFKSQLHAGKIS